MTEGVSPAKPPKSQCCMCYASMEKGRDGVERQDGKLRICTKCVHIANRAVHGEMCFPTGESIDNLSTKPKNLSTRKGPMLRDPRMEAFKVIDYTLYSMLSERVS